MTLAELLNEALAVPKEVLAHVATHEVTGVEQDSRRIGPGAVFVARRGAVVDGHKFVQQAQAAGALAVVGEADVHEQEALGLEVPYISVADDKAALAKLAAAFYAHPSRALVTLGITGTDGKTTTSYLVHYLLLGRYNTGLISTASVHINTTPLDLIGHFTTPEAPQVQAFLAQFRHEGCSHAVIESSSHGFAMRRLDGVTYDVALWTNLTPEHLDYHQTLEAYRDAKLELIRRAPVSILNADDEHSRYFQETARARGAQVITYGLDHPEADWRASAVQTYAGGLTFVLHTPEGTWDAVVPMLGRYNVYNALASLAAAQHVGVPFPEALERLKAFQGVPGRNQLVQLKPFMVVVDFAHTAPALQKALVSLRPQVSGRIIVVIGAAGERDPGKRIPLGHVSATYADLAIFTEEDSRSEDVHDILKAMAKGAEAAGAAAQKHYWLIWDRREAIRQAVAMARPGDLVLCAGKGHEATLERAQETLPWNEVAEVKQALKE